jgi:hypothetical protein
MLARFRRAMNYWMFGISHPGYVLEFAQRDQHRVRISFYIILVFSLLYSFSSWMMWTGGRVPYWQTWIPYILPNQQYFFQVFLIPLWMVVTYLAIAGFIYLFTCLSGKQSYFEDSLMIASLSIAIPYLMFWWVPETFLIPVMGPGSSLNWPELFELERKFIFPGIWQFFLVAFGMRKLNNTNRIACLAAGLFAVLTLFCLYLPFIR